MFRKKKEKLIDLNDEQQLKLINLIFKDCNKRIAEIVDLFEKWKWDEFIKEDEPEKIFYMLILAELYIYDSMLKGTYSKDVCTNVIVTILEEFAKGFEKEPEPFIKKAIYDIIEMDKYLDNAVTKGVDVYSAMFLYITKESCDVPYEIYTNPKEVMPLFVQMVFNDTAEDFSNILNKIK